MGFRGFKPPPPTFSDFFLKSEGKEVERKKNEKGCGGGGYLLTYFLGVEIFPEGVEKFFFLGGGVRNFRQGVRNFRGG